MPSGRPSSLPSRIHPACFCLRSSMAFDCSALASSMRAVWRAAFFSLVHRYVPSRRPADTTAELRLACVRAWNDYQSEFASVAPERFVLLAMLPFWDRDESVREMERCVALGHRGVLFANSRVASVTMIATTSAHDMLEGYVPAGSDKPRDGSRRRTRGVDRCGSGSSARG